ncbi:MAG: UDP-N-acetylmuramoyl-tripeptide--D-alanyl-D-alanine ligase [Prevotellaceae bacterium]|nr:UDP-N-acetylmuramoyl-tripeptide--D-alanyl-D-alanine ligase [Prevotellaceae bacterium]
MDIKALYELYKSHPVVTTDSRDCPSGSIFIALKGASFDGNKFAGAALAKGCSYVIVDEPEYAKNNDPRIILVDDCLTTYKELAREHRRQFNIPVIGITGTNGKTTTKELLSAVLAEKYNVMHTEGNFNNDIGVPKTLLRLAPEHQIAVIEMGASHPGDIKKLVEYAEPTCGLITNVGRAHLQGFGSFEGVMRTKGELYDFLKAHNALTFLNTSNSYLVEMARLRELERIVSYGQDKQSNVWGHVVCADPFLKIEWNADTLTFKLQADDDLKDNSDADNNGTMMQVQSHLIGTYNLDNILAAITVGLHFGVTPAQICHALEHYVPANNRSQLTTTADNWLIVDAYNANPTSMAAAISNFTHISVAQPKMAILGDMRELGDVSAEEHQKIVDSLASAGLDEVWLVGDEFMKTRCNFRKFNNVEEVKNAIREQKPRGRYILVKGSNGIKLFELPELL